MWYLIVYFVRKNCRIFSLKMRKKVCLLCKIDKHPANYYRTFAGCFLLNFDIGKIIEENFLKNRLLCKCGNAICNSDLIKTDRGSVFSIFYSYGVPGK